MEPEREFRFHRPKLWRFDFAWPSVKVACEIEGGTWMKISRHTSGKGFEADCIKYAQAIKDGWTVYRCTTGMVKSGVALADIETILKLKMGEP